MIRKKMLDVKVFSSGGREEKVRIFNIPGTDDYYVSGKEFDAKSSKYYGVLYFMVPDQRIGDEDEYHPITDLPDYVRKIYRMDDGQITEMVYDNTYGKEQDGKTDEKGISPSKEQDGKTEEKGLTLSTSCVIIIM